MIARVKPDDAVKPSYFNKSLESDPNGKSPHEKGSKLDEGKTRMSLLFYGFPRALEAIGRVATYGANKYTDDGWSEVPNGIQRYTDAMGRHMMKEGEGILVDVESMQLEAAHIAWNAVARLELILRLEEGLKDPSISPIVQQTEQLTEDSNCDLNKPAPGDKITMADTHIFLDGLVWVWNNGKDLKVARRAKDLIQRHGNIRVICSCLEDNSKVDQWDNFRLFTKLDFLNWEDRNIASMYEKVLGRDSTARGELLAVCGNKNSLSNRDDRKTTIRKFHSICYDDDSILTYSEVSGLELEKWHDYRVPTEGEKAAYLRDK